LGTVLKENGTSERLRKYLIMQNLSRFCDPVPNTPEYVFELGDDPKLYVNSVGERVLNAATDPIFSIIKAINIQHRNAVPNDRTTRFRYNDGDRARIRSIMKKIDDGKKSKYESILSKKHEEELVKRYLSHMFNDMKVVNTKFSFGVTVVVPYSPPEKMAGDISAYVEFYAAKYIFTDYSIFQSPSLSPKAVNPHYTEFKTVIPNHGIAKNIAFFKLVSRVINKDDITGVLVLGAGVGWGYPIRELFNEDRIDVTITNLTVSDRQLLVNEASAPDTYVLNAMRCYTMPKLVWADVRANPYKQTDALSLSSDIFEHGFYLHLLCQLLVTSAVCGSAVCMKMIGLPPDVAVQLFILNKHVDLYILKVNRVKNLEWFVFWNFKNSMSQEDALAIITDRYRMENVLDMRRALAYISGYISRLFSLRDGDLTRPLIIDSLQLPKQ
jgi:hypothetical protein